MTTNTGDVAPALLTRSEVQWLLNGQSADSKTCRDMRYRINKKLSTFSNIELPLLHDSGFAAAISGDAAATNSDAQEAKTGRAKGVNLQVVHKTSPRWDSDPRPKVLSTFKTEGLRNLRSARLSY